MAKHFLDLSAVSESDLRVIMDDAHARKAANKAGTEAKPLAGKMLAMIFEKPSTRTRVSFDAETIGDTAKVLSRYVDAIMIRTTDHARLLELAEHATVPVINALTDLTHPCQIMADIMTFEEHRGSTKGKTFTWTGDGNNVLHSFVEGSARFGYTMKMAVPMGSEPDDKILNWARDNGGNILLGHDVEAMVDGADLVVTDTWVSMNQEHRARGHNIFQPYQVNPQLMARAGKDALFMHCLPAHRGEEVTDEVIDGPQSVVFDEAENRLHAQKSILAWCFGAV
jgi:ornithine carbamoyltransferase